MASAAWSSRSRCGEAVAPREPSTRRSSRPPRTPPSTSVVPGSTWEPADRPDRTSSSRRSSSRTPGSERATTSAVPEELNSSSGPTAPTPMAATGWSWPATVRAAPCSAGGSPAYRSSPARRPAGDAGGSSVVGRPAAATPSAQTSPVAWSTRPVRGRQRGLPDEIARRAGGRPTPARWPSGGPAVRVRPSLCSHSSLARLAWQSHGKPVRRANCSASAGSRAPSLATCSVPRWSNQATTGAHGSPAGVEQHPALGEAGDTDAEGADRADPYLGSPHDPAQQLDRERRTRPAPGSRCRRRPMVHGVRVSTSASCRPPRSRTRAFELVVPRSSPTTTSVRRSWPQLP